MICFRGVLWIVHASLRKTGAGLNIMRMKIILVLFFKREWEMAFLLEGTLEKTECGNRVYVEIDLCYMRHCWEEDQG